jgi:hypothetical protein
VPILAREHESRPTVIMPGGPNGRAPLEQQPRALKGAYLACRHQRSEAIRLERVHVRAAVEQGASAAHVRVAAADHQGRPTVALGMVDSHALLD